MVRRVMWLGTGVVIGAGSSVWAMRRVQRSVRRLAPDHVVREAVTGARQVLDRVSDAAREGAAAMRQREEELRGGLRGGRLPSA